MQRRDFHTPAFDEIGILAATEVVNASRTLYLSGLVAEDKPGLPLKAQDMKTQLTAALDTVEKTLREAGYTLADVVRLHVYTTDVPALMACHDVLSERLRQGGAKIVGVLAGVAALALPDFKVEIEATAVK